MARQKRSQPQPKPAGAQFLAVIAALVALATWVYWPVSSFDFAAYDDYEFIVENSNVATGLSFTNLRWALSHPYEATGGPVTWISHMADVQYFGLVAGPQHVINVVIHIVTTLLLLVVLRSITGSTVRSGVVAALFAVHPLHVESVAWIAERKDVLSGLFWFATIAAYAHYTRAPGWVRYALVLVTFCLGLLSKPMVVTLPAVLLILDMWPLGRWRPPSGHTIDWRLVIEKIPLILLAAGAITLTYLSQYSGGSVAASDAVPLGLRLANASVSVATYLQKAVWPTGLIPYYPYPASIPVWKTAVCLLVLIAITVAAWRLRHKAPMVIVGWLWYLVALIPVVGLVQVGGHARADRFTYLPLVGIFMAVAWGLADVARKWSIPAWVQVATAAVAVTTGAVVARAQVWHWQDGLTLWRHTIRVDPANARAQSNLGAVLIMQDRFAEALEPLESAVRLDPQVAKTQFNLGLALEETARTSEAVEHYRAAMALDPGYVKPIQQLANIFAKAGNTPEAVALYNRALAITPENPLLHVNLAVTLGPRQGLPHMQQAIRLEPTNAQWPYFAALMELELGRVAEARVLLQSALRIDPTYGDAARKLAEINR